jgi:hypothetical protein
VFKWLLIGLTLAVSVVKAQEVDPTQPFGAEKSRATSKRSALVLQSIIYSTVQPKAVINGRVLMEGSSILGYKVVKINNQTVELRSENKRLTLPLFTHSVSEAFNKK